ncbi:MAG: glucose-1-phosphate adenylyltransferase [Deltaproteobacteria bacterium]|nr:glucose-1-phosphate adenylyltransferase [Deltaproteobacteria bacterium]
MSRTLVMLLAGGRGTRLNILGAHRAKPAVPFAGLYRIIDFALSNCMYSRFLQVGVLTQYRPVSLLNHLGNGAHWDMAGKTGILKNLPPFQASRDFDWYHGTAHAILQNLDFIRRSRPERVLILSGDHIYRMKYREMVEYHVDKGADLTIAAMPVAPEETHRFGIIVQDADYRITEFQEKPAQAKSNLASMGIYVFRTETLEQVLLEMAKGPGNDFGKDVIPGMLGRFHLQVYPFAGYWRDVGTIDSYFEANMDVLNPESGIDLAEWKTRTNLHYEGVQSMPPASLEGTGRVTDSMISPGVRIRGTVHRSILSPGVVIEEGAVVEDSIVMHRSRIGADAHLTRTIVDKWCVVGERAVVGHRTKAVPNRLTPTHLSEGLVVVGRNATVPSGAVVGSNVIIHPWVSAPDYHGARVEDGETVVPLPSR